MRGASPRLAYTLYRSEIKRHYRRLHVLRQRAIKLAVVGILISSTSSSHNFVHFFPKIKEIKAPIVPPPPPHTHRYPPNGPTFRPPNRRPNPHPPRMASPLPPHLHPPRVPHRHPRRLPRPLPRQRLPQPLRPLPLQRLKQVHRELRRRAARRVAAYAEIHMS